MSFLQEFPTIIWKFCNLGAEAGDSDQLRLTKAILTLTALIIAFLAIFWSSLYIFIGYPYSGAIPLGYAVISFVSIVVFFITKRFEFFRFSQLLLIFLLPFLLMWSLGGFANGSVVMVWAFFSPLAAMFFADKSQMKRWVIAFAVFTLISGLIDPYIKDMVKPMAPIYNTAFFVMNMGAGFLSVYFILLSFVNDREESHRQAIVAREAAVAAQANLEKANEKLKENEARIRTLMLTDALTDVPNRRYFEEKLKQEVNRAQRHDQQLVLAIADIDHFKSINDEYGHDTGDHVIKSFAACMRDAIRNYDFLARIGGEEFVILLTDTDMTAAKKLIERIRKDFSQIEFPNIERSLTASFGLALLQRDESGHACLKRADDALYRSKNEGRNRISLAS